MPSCEFMCLECGHTFEVFTTSEDIEDGDEVECPLCGSTQTTRTYGDGTESEGDDLDEEDDSGLTPDDE